jgi:hypothetical protein
MGIKIAKVEFKGTNYKHYDFLTDLDLKVGDTVVCDCTTGLNIAKVVEISSDSAAATRWIVQKVDLDAFSLRREKLAKMNKLYTKMVKKANQMFVLDKLAVFAEKDPDIAAMLIEYRELESETNG